jgi:SET domain-containing protein
MTKRTLSSRSPERAFRVGRAHTGLGLFATEPIAKGAFIAAYRGVRISHAEAERREARGARYIFEINSRWSIDGSDRRNLARYANHSCRPNAESALSKGRLILRAIRPIATGDEITFDYGEEYFDLFIRPLGCQCVKCRDRRPKSRKTKG